MNVETAVADRVLRGGSIELDFAGFIVESAVFDQVMMLIMNRRGMEFIVEHAVKDCALSIVGN